jgi:DNA repair protein RadC|tara:strand:- start:6172 stop:6282 length:111 start_codon:yes stop_codon:yes gene_type:complete
MTRQVQTAAEALGLTLHDHIVIGKSSEVSFRSSGFL